MKKDINLIPKSDRRISRETLIVIVLLIVCVLLVASYFGVYTPIKQKKYYNDIIKQNELEIQSYSMYEALFISLAEEESQLKQKLQIFTELKDQYLKPTQILSDFESYIPSNMTLDSISLTDETLSLSGTTSTYEEIAQFIVNLRKVDYVSDLIFHNAVLTEQEETNQVETEQEDNDQEVTNQEKTIQEENYQFSMTIFMKQTEDELQDDSEDLSEEDTTSEEGNEG